MRTIAVLPCGKRKVWDKSIDAGPSKVEDVYIGTLHRLTRQYAELFADDWVILSAKHGFRSKNEIIHNNYDLTFGMKHPCEVTKEVLKRQRDRKEMDKYDRAIILTGKKHQRVITAIGGITEDDQYPLLGTKGIGEMQQRLKQAIDTNEPI